MEEWKLHDDGIKELASPTCVFGKRDGLCVLPAILAKVLLECEQARVEFPQRRDIRIIRFAAEEVEHGRHLFI